MAPARFDKRSERYHYLRDLGYSARDAKYWSHRAGPAEVAEVQRRYDEYREIRNRDRTYEQQQFINRVRATTSVENERIFYSKSDRVGQWAKWSDKFGEGFPPNHAEQIRKLNTAAGYDEKAKYGYRAYWYYWVGGADPSEAEELASGYEEE